MRSHSATVVSSKGYAAATSRVGDHCVHTAVRQYRSLKGCLHTGFIPHVGGRSERAAVTVGFVERGGSLLGPCRIDIKDHHLRAGGGESLGDGFANAAGSAGHERHAARKLRFRRRERELVEFQRPVLNAKRFGVGHRGVAVHGLGAGDIDNGAMVEAPGNACAFQVFPGSNHAQPGNENDPWIGIKHLLTVPRVSGEILRVVLGICVNAAAYARAEVRHIFPNRVPSPQRAVGASCERGDRDRPRPAGRVPLRAHYSHS